MSIKLNQFGLIPGHPHDHKKWIDFINRVFTVGYFNRDEIQPPHYYVSNIIKREMAILCIEELEILDCWVSTNPDTKLNYRLDFNIKTTQGVCPKYNSITVQFINHYTDYLCNFN